MLKEYNRNSPVYGEFKAPNKDMVAGRLVTFDASDPTKIDYATQATPTAKILGLLGQDVIAPNVNTHILPSVATTKVRYGEVVAVFYNDIYITDQIATNVNAGDMLWPADSSTDATLAGKLSNVEIVYQPPVAVALESGAAGSPVKIKLLV
jgi:hypothetical protein